jgi:3-oxoacyl-[acyl-carrier-protein] synthase II
MRRVVVTGMGAVTCLGHSVEETWRALVEGRSGLGRIEKFDPTGLRNEAAGEVKGLAADGADPAGRFALMASEEALVAAGLAAGLGEPERGGVICSTNFGGADSWERWVASAREGRADPGALAGSDFAAPCRMIAERRGLRGPATTLSLSCSSSAAAMGLALDLIRADRADVMLAGGHDTLSYSSLAGLSILRTITAEQIRPFDKRRSGTIFGEGAAMLVLEEREHAQARGAPILAELLGYAVNNNAYHLTAPDKGGEGLRHALEGALADAGVAADALDYINAHGTGTPYHDVAETVAIKAALGDHAYRIPVSSIKAATGHIMAGAGALEAIATVLAMRDGVVPPTLNYGEPDPDCDLDYVPNEARAHPVNVAASISSGIGGNNAAVVLRRGAGQP